MTDKETKSGIRSRILKIRNALTEEERSRAACLLTERILGHPWYCLSDTILCYADYGSEISTGELIGKRWRQGKRFFCPGWRETA